MTRTVTERSKAFDAGMSFGASEANKARVALASSITWNSACSWLNRVIDDVAARHAQAEAWEWGCRCMFLLKIERSLPCSTGVWISPLPLSTPSARP
jgi:hypothetical protein